MANVALMQLIIPSYFNAVVATFSRFDACDKTKQDIHDGWYTKMIQQPINKVTPRL